MGERVGLGALRIVPAVRVLLVVYGSLETLSGGYLYDRTLVRRLEAEGYPVRVHSQRLRAPYLANLAGNADPSLIRAAEDWRPDIIVQDELNHPSLFLLNRALERRIPAPRIGLVHHLKSLEEGPVLERAAARRIERAYLAGLDGFIFNSEFTRSSVEAVLGPGLGGPPDSAGKPWVVAPPGKDRLAGFSPRNAFVHRDGTSLRILFLGNVIPRKGLHVLVEALARIPDRPWSLTIAGRTDADPGYASRVLGRIREAGLDSRVSRLEAPGDSELPGVFRSHDLLAVPSQCEGFGIVYAEALTFGLPVIAGDLGGAGEIVYQGENGYRVPWGDAEALAGRLSALADEPDRLRALSRAARQSADRLPTWEESMGRIVDFLAGLVRKKD